MWYCPAQQVKTKGDECVVHGIVHSCTSALCDIRKGLNRGIMFNTYIPTLIHTYVLTRTCTCTGAWPATIVETACCNYRCRHVKLQDRRGCHVPSQRRFRANVRAHCKYIHTYKNTYMHMCIHINVAPRQRQTGANWHQQVRAHFLQVCMSSVVCVFVWTPALYTSHVL